MITDRRGTPLAIRITSTIRHAARLLEASLDALVATDVAMTALRDRGTIPA